MRKVEITFLLFALLGCVSLTSVAQLSTRENLPSHIKSGTRPTAGDFGFFIGSSFGEIVDMVDQDIEVRGVPLLNFKYYSSDRNVFRLGLQYYKTSEKLKGELESSSLEVSDIRSESMFRIQPGYEYHFSPKNLLDVYVGAAIPLGYERKKFENGTEDDGVKTSRFTLTAGYNVFIGFQSFVADLPLALGVEFGISGIRHSGLKYKHEVTSGGSTTTYYTTDEYGVGAQYSELKYKKYEAGADMRITISYFFGN